MWFRGKPVGSPKLDKEWKCENCGHDEDDKWFMKAFGEDEICITCWSWVSAERRERIKIAEAAMPGVVSVLTVPDPYRGGGFKLHIDLKQTWKLAWEIAQANPFRRKDYDKWIRDPTY